MNTNFLKSINRLKLPGFIFIVTCLFVFSFKAEAQTNANVEKLYLQAKTFYDSGKHKQAIVLSKQVVAMDSAHVNAHLILAYSYEAIDSVNLQIFYLKKALEIKDVPDANYWLGEAYYDLEQYSEALYYFNRYKDYKYVPLKRKLVLACKMADGTFKIQSLKNSINNNQSETSDADQYWPVSSKDGKALLFEPLAKENQSTIKNFEKITNIENESSTVSEPEIVFFSACNRPDGLGNCDIYFSRIVDGVWSEAKNAGPKLNTEFLETQPSFSAENNMLYFSSNRPGGKGAKDIWSAKLTGFSEEGLPLWAWVENRSEINSESNEISPFIDAKKQSLYFASDAPVGMGGFDLFQSSVSGGGGIKDVQNLGYPINTTADELGLLITYMYDTAFFTSARSKDDGLEIFAFNLTRGLNTEPSNYMRIKLINKKTKQPVLASFELVGLNSRADQIKIETTNADGEKIVRVRPKRNYTLNVNENGFMFYSKEIFQDNTNTLEEPNELIVELDPIEMGAEIDLYNINYETNSYAILPQSETELDRLVTFLAGNNAVNVEIQGHTDSTGDPAANLKLSELRAKSVIDYLVQHKISSTRLKHIGYGDKVPLASNDTEQGRRLNRRTTIKITGL